MFKSKLLCTAILTLTLATTAEAQTLELTSIPQPTEQPAGRIVQNPDAVALKLAAEWISAVFNLPKIETLPNVRRLPAEKYTRSRTGIPTDSLLETAQPSGQRETVVPYDDATKTIYLPSRWSGSTPAQMSGLVHATARHFQNIGARRSYDCPEERNAQPYEAQERWLGLYGTNLSEEFGIDAATLLLITQCVP